MSFFKAILSFLVTVFTLGITFRFGQRLTAYWNLWQKRHELNAASLQAFHDLYGEFKENIKIWRVMKRPAPQLAINPAERWMLLSRACAIESKTEALVLRLATERVLKDGQPTDIGLFRQAMQTQRESIIKDVENPLGSRREEYDLLNRLASAVASIIYAELPKAPLKPAECHRQLREIVGVTKERWLEEVDAVRKALPKNQADTSATID